MKVDYGKIAFYNTKFGIIKIGYLNDSITYLKFLTEENTDIFDEGERSLLTQKTYSEIVEYLDGKRDIFDIPFLLFGTDFQKKVWNELLKIPYGETRMYKDIAKSVENSKASRAIGMACHKNPILLIVPCHRVIGSKGKLVGYAGGLDRKNDFLQIEKKNKQLNLFDSI